MNSPSTYPTLAPATGSVKGASEIARAAEAAISAKMSGVLEGS